jgi:hypothetical protein
MGHRRANEILDPRLLDDFIERAHTDIREGGMDSVVDVLNRMSKKSGLVCTAYLTAYLAKNDSTNFQMFLDRLEENPL